MLQDAAGSAPRPLSPEEHQQLSGEIDEIDFFLSMDALEDARNLIDEAVKTFDRQPDLLHRLNQLEEMEQAASRPLPSVAEDEPQPQEPEDETPENLLEKDTGFFDLAAELSEELFDESEEVNDKTTGEEIQSVEELFQEFKKGVDEQIDEDDSETHYDLGIAYKEMGLLEESIAQFRKAERDPNRLMECATMIGACMIELGQADRAVEHFSGLIERGGRSDDELASLRYELAHAYEGMGDIEKALEIYREIEAYDPTFRDLQSRIQALA